MIGPISMSEKPQLQALAKLLPPSDKTLLLRLCQGSIFSPVGLYRIYHD
jgi:hypothetical protein